MRGEAGSHMLGCGYGVQLGGSGALRGATGVQSVLCVGRSLQLVMSSHKVGEIEACCAHSVQLRQSSACTEQEKHMSSYSQGVQLNCSKALQEACEPQNMWTQGVLLRQSEAGDCSNTNSCLDCFRRVPWKYCCYILSVAY